MWVFMARGKLDRQALLPSLVLGIMLFAGYAFQTWGLVFTTPSKSAFITGFSVILVPVISLFHGYRLRPANAMGAGLGLLGLYFLVVPSALGTVNRGDFMTLFGAMAFAVHIVLVGTYTRRISFLHLAPGQILVVGLLATMAIPFSSTSTVHWTRSLVLAFVVTAVFATAFAFGTEVGAEQYMPPAHTALIFALEPVFAALTSRVVMKEHLGGKVLLGSRPHFGRDGGIGSMGRGPAGSRRGLGPRAPFSPTPNRSTTCRVPQGLVKVIPLWSAGLAPAFRAGSLLPALEFSHIMSHSPAKKPQPLALLGRYTAKWRGAQARHPRTPYLGSLDARGTSAVWRLGRHRVGG